MEFFGDEANGKDLTLQVLGSERGTGKLFVALYDDGGAGAMAAAEEKKLPALHLPTSSSAAAESDSRPPEDGAASSWGPSSCGAKATATTG